MSSTATPSYLAAAARADTLTELGGVACVMGEATDALTGQRRCLVEYAEPAGLADPVWAGDLLACVVSGHPYAEAVIVRTGADVTLPAPWMPHLTYLRYDPGPAGSRTRASAPAGLRVAAAGPRHRAAVHEWLADALQTGAAEQGMPVVRADALAQASELMQAPGRRSFVAFAGLRPTGHGTVLDFTDEVTDTDYLELFDVLVDSRALRTVPASPSEVSAALVAACLRQAAQASRPLLGNVIHHHGIDSDGADRHRDDAGPEHGARVVAALVRRGWRTDHRYWWATATAPSLEAP